MRIPSLFECDGKRNNLQQVIPQRQGNKSKIHEETKLTTEEERKMQEDLMLTNGIYCDKPGCSIVGLFNCSFCNKNFCLQHKTTITIVNYSKQYVCTSCLDTNKHAKLTYDLENAYLIKEKRSFKQRIINFCSLEWIWG